jgi:hypothetical protein
MEAGGWGTLETDLVIRPVQDDFDLKMRSVQIGNNDFGVCDPE